MAVVDMVTLLSIVCLSVGAGLQWGLPFGLMTFGGVVLILLAMNGLMARRG